MQHIGYWCKGWDGSDSEGILHRFGSELKRYPLPPILLGIITDHQAFPINRDLLFVACACKSRPRCCR